PALQGRAAQLRVLVRQRAAALYERGGSGPDWEILAGADDVLEAARASHLANLATASDVALAEGLQKTADTLTARENQLRVTRSELERAGAETSAIRARLDRQLALASSAYDKVMTAVAANAGAVSPSSAMRCPVDGFTVFTDDFGEPRENNAIHEG